MEDKEIYTGAERRGVHPNRDEMVVWKAVMKSAFKEAIQDIAADKELVNTFWKCGYDQLTSHASTNASQWIGKRILTGLVTMVFGWALYYLAKNGVPVK